MPQDDIDARIQTYYGTSPRTPASPPAPRRVRSSLRDLSGHLCAVARIR